MLRALPASAQVGLTVACALLGSLPAAAQPGAADKGRLVVLELTTPPTMIGLGAQVAQEIQNAARDQGFTVVTSEEVREALGSQAYEALRQCGAQPTCIAGRLAPIGAQRVVFGSLRRDERAYLLKLFFVDLDSSEVIAEVDRAILIASRRFRQDVAEAVPRMLRGEREATGTLEVTADVSNVDVWIDGAPVGRTPLEVALKPGKYEVRLEKKAYLPVRRLVDVNAQQVTKESFRMLVKPGEVPEDEALPPLAATVTAPTPDRHLRVTPPAWAAFGAGVAAAGVGGYFGLRAQATERDLQSVGGTRAQALQGRQDARTANILFGAAGMAIAAGALFTFFDVGGTDDGAEVTAVPATGPDGAGIALGGVFW